MATDTPVWLGCECEYAVMGTDSAGRGQFGHALLDFIRERLQWLPDYSSDGFMSAFGRLYIDCGCHPEISIRPCSNPYDAVDTINYLQSFAVEFARRHENRLFLSRACVDYCSRTTWGNHDCYSVESGSAINAAFVIPHLVTRSVIAGSGGFQIDGRVPKVRFCLSPRAQFVDAVAGQTGFPIWQVKPGMASRFDTRVHIRVGENVTSNLALGLKLGTTALVIALAAEEPQLLRRVPVLADPVEAIKDISNTWWCHRSCPVRTRDGAWVEPLEIQRLYLELVSEYSDRAGLPPWSKWLTRIWSEVLDSLEAGIPGPSADEGDAQKRSWGLDWLAKKDVFETCLREEGYTLTDLQKRTVPKELAYRLLRCDMDWARLTDDGPGHQWAQQEEARFPLVSPWGPDNAPFYPVTGAAKSRSDTIRAKSADSRYICSWSYVADRQTHEVIDRFTDSDGDASARWSKTRAIVDNLEEYLVGG